MSGYASFWQDDCGRIQINNNIVKVAVILFINALNCG